MSDWICTALERREQYSWIAHTDSIFWNSNSGTLDPAPFRLSDYLLYAVLADVRNEEFGIAPICTPRGLPADLSEEAQGILFPYPCPMEPDKNVIGGGSTIDHSFFGFTWILGKELLDYDYDQLIPRTKHTEARYGLDFFKSSPSIRAALGKRYFEHLVTMKTLASPEDLRLTVCFW